jgi:hypothetical protein
MGRLFILRHKITSVQYSFASGSVSFHKNKSLPPMLKPLSVFQRTCPLAAIFLTALGSAFVCSPARATITHTKKSTKAFLVNTRRSTFLFIACLLAPAFLPAGDAGAALSGRRTPGPDFSIVLLPDTQCYTAQIRGGDKRMFYSQISWIIKNNKKQNIAAVLHLGDITQYGDKIREGKGELEWTRAGAGALHKLEDPKATGRLPDGIPYCVAMGNHDQRKPDASFGGEGAWFNKHFGVEHFRGKSYYGGPYGKNNNSHFMLFDAGPEKFVVVSLAFGAPRADPRLLKWARSLLEKHADRRAIILTHYTMRAGVPGEFGDSDGRAAYLALRDRPNLMLIVGGHVSGEGRRSDVHDGRVVHSILRDYQGEEGGGNGYLCILTLSPRRGKITGKTYSPYLDKWRDTGDGSFELDYDFDAGRTAESAETGRATVRHGRIAGRARGRPAAGAGGGWRVIPAGARPAEPCAFAPRLMVKP